MSDLLVHWAVYEDSRRLSAVDGGIDPLLSGTMEQEREFARLGAIARGGGWWVPHILSGARAQWQAATDKTMLRRKLAFALGGITHYAADAVMKNVMRAAAGVEPQSRHRLTGQQQADYKEASAYFDVHVFREVYLAGDEEPFNEFLLRSNSTRAGEALEQFVMSLFQRSLLSSHTFDPDKGVGEAWSGNFDGWLDNLFGRIQPLYMDIRQYCDIFATPDPAKIDRYGVTSSFYNAADPIIATARALQHGQAISEEQVHAALHSDANQSAYARILTLSQSRLRDASAYWNNQSEKTPDVGQ